MTKEKKILKAGSKVKLLVGSKGERGETFSITKIKGDRVFLDGYRMRKRTAKLNKDNTKNFVTVHHSVNISNVKLEV